MTKVTELAFALYGRRAGTIVRDRNRIGLSYDTAYLGAANPTPLSLSMPLSADVYPTRSVEAFLKGLLPDHEEVRTRWARRFQVSPGDTLGLIAAIGADTAGAAVFAAPDELDDLLARPGAVEPLSEVDIAGRLRQLRQDDGAWHDEHDEHWSLAGGQGKFALVRRADGGWGLPSGSVASTHIIKPGISRIRSQALAEHVSMRALGLLGLDVATTEHVLFDDQPAIVVTRYDRRPNQAGTVVRIHQEDMVQTFAMDPRRKYEADRGPGVGAIIKRLRTAADDDSAARFTDATIAGYLLGAPDGHAKNYSMLLLGRTARLAPLYDVSTGLVPSATGRLRYTSAAMSIGGEKAFGEVEAKHWVRFAKVVGQPEEAILQRVRSLAESVPDAFRDAIRELPRSEEATFLSAVVLPSIAALDAQTVTGLTSSRRTGGRVVVPFVRTLEATPVTGTEADPDDGIEPGDEIDTWDGGPVASHR
ncbi:type II toxin-antitoxin system HipA family toxin [Sanguibacter sp. 25GB23B1]|uniref:type II toxin-antitoxin system HipA family toxin n=1 Tax=unclassified Sanguibacter TaxID=2645534 RepID=UPI0032AE90AB